MKITNKIQISDIPIVLALIFLAITPLLLVQKQEIVGDEIAIYAYYLLVIGIAWKVILYLRTKQPTRIQG